MYSRYIPFCNDTCLRNKAMVPFLPMGLRCVDRATPQNPRAMRGGKVSGVRSPHKAKKRGQEAKKRTSARTRMIKDFWDQPGTKGSTVRRLAPTVTNSTVFAGDTDHTPCELAHLATQNIWTAANMSESALKFARAAAPGVISDDDALVITKAYTAMRAIGIAATKAMERKMKQESKELAEAELAEAEA